MAITPKPNVNTVWASAGTITDPGQAKIEEGWLAEKPPREFENYQRNKEGNFLKHVNQRGIPEWDSLTEYDVGSLVIASDNSTYSSKTAANIGNDPVTSSLNWSVVITSGGITSSKPNIVIGGNFDTNPWSRGQALSNAYAAVAAVPSRYLTADRIALFDDGTIPLTADVSAEKIQDAPSLAQSDIFSEHCLRFKVTTDQATITNDKEVGFLYNVEGYDFLKIAQKQFTISFFVKTNKSGKYGASLQNDGGDRRIDFNFEITPPQVNIWTKITLLVPPSPASGAWNYDILRGLTFSIVLAAGSNFFGTNFNTWETVIPGQGNIPSDIVNFFDAINNEFSIQLIKIEEGDKSTPWLEPVFANTQAMLDRYFEKSYKAEDKPGTITGECIRIYQTITGSQQHSYPLKTKKRPAGGTLDPSLILSKIYSPSAGTLGFVDVNTTPTAVSSISANENTLFFELNANAGDEIKFCYTVESEIQ